MRSFRLRPSGAIDDVRHAGQFRITGVSTMPQTAARAANDHECKHHRSSSVHTSGRARVGHPPRGRPAGVVPPTAAGGGERFELPGRLASGRRENGCEATGLFRGYDSITEKRPIPALANHIGDSCAQATCLKSRPAGHYGTGSLDGARFSSFCSSSNNLRAWVSRGRSDDRDRRLLSGLGMPPHFLENSSELQTSIRFQGHKGEMACWS